MTPLFVWSGVSYSLKVFLVDLAPKNTIQSIQQKMLQTKLTTEFWSTKTPPSNKGSWNITNPKPHVFLFWCEILELDSTMHQVILSLIPPGSHWDRLDPWPNGVPWYPCEWYLRSVSWTGSKKKGRSMKHTPGKGSFVLFFDVIDRSLGPRGFS